MCVGRAVWGGGEGRGAEAGGEGMKKDMAARNTSCTGPERLIMLCRKGRCVWEGRGGGGTLCCAFTQKSREFPFGIESRKTTNGPFPKSIDQVTSPR